MTANYIKLINCATPEEVHHRVREWSSNLSDKHHLIRSTILEIHANLETRMKQILFHHMAALVRRTFDESKNQQHLDQLATRIRKMHFSHVHKLLQPCFHAFESHKLEHDLPALNEARVDAAHGDPSTAKYKNRNPFEDADCLAQLFFDAWAVNKELGEFFEKMVEDAEAARKVGERYWLGLPLVERSAESTPEEK